MCRSGMLQASGDAAVHAERRATHVQRAVAVVKYAAIEGRNCTVAHAAVGVLSTPGKVPGCWPQAQALVNAQYSSLERHELFLVPERMTVKALVSS